MYTRTHAHSYITYYICTHAHMHTLNRTRTRAHIHVHAYTHAHTHAAIRMTSPPLPPSMRVPASVRYLPWKCAPGAPVVAVGDTPGQRKGADTHTHTRARRTHGRTHIYSHTHTYVHTHT